jgi:hypothetical protein
MFESRHGSARSLRPQRLVIFENKKPAGTGGLFCLGSLRFPATGAE